MNEVTAQNVQSYHEMADKLQIIIVNTLKDKSPELKVMFIKNRVDETSADKIERLAAIHLKGKSKEQVLQAFGLLKQCIDALSNYYLGWAQSTGVFLGNQMSVDPNTVDSKSAEGLTLALWRYKPNGSFTSYATSWIRQTIGRSVDRRLLYTLDSPMKEGEDSTHIDGIAPNDAVFVGDYERYNDPFFLECHLESLRQKYCPHLDVETMVYLMRLKDDQLALEEERADAILIDRRHRQGINQLAA